jgi:hypothetical protein
VKTEEPDSNMPLPGLIPPTPASTRPKPTTESPSQLSSVTRMDSGAAQASSRSLLSNVRQRSATNWNGPRTTSRISLV